MEPFKGINSFSPATGFQKTGKSTLAPTAFSEKVPYYLLPDNCTEEQRLMFSRYLAYCGTATAGKLASWKTWVTTWVCLVTPAFSARLPVSSFRKVEITAQQTARLTLLMGNLQEALDSEDRSQVTIAGTELLAMSEYPLLPKISDEVDLALGNGEWIGKVALCYYALVLFLAGKRLEGEDHSQLSDLRPRALRGKAHIEDPLDFLEGGLRMSDFSHLSINNAWSEMGQLRAIVFTEYAGYDSDDTDMAKDIIWTTMHLLRYSNMAHALITYNFLRAYPWAADVPSLKTSIAIYFASLKKSSEIDQKLFPFIKLIYGDKAGLFPRKEMEPLIACASSVQQETSSTLADFYRDATFNPVVDSFMTEKERRENIRNLGLVKREKELLDYVGDIDDDGTNETPASTPENAQ